MWRSLPPLLTIGDDRQTVTELGSKAIHPPWGDHSGHWAPSVPGVTKVPSGCGVNHEDPARAVRRTSVARRRNPATTCRGTPSRSPSDGHKPSRGSAVVAATNTGRPPRQDPVASKRRQAVRRPRHVEQDVHPGDRAFGAPHPSCRSPGWRADREDERTVPGDGFGISESADEESVATTLKEHQAGMPATAIR